MSFSKLTTLRPFYFLRQLYFHNFGINIDKDMERATFYTWTQDICSILLRYIKVDDEKESAVIWTKNASSSFLSLLQN